MLDPAMQIVVSMVKHYHGPVVILDVDETACRICGCTDDEACVDLDGQPCTWVDDGLCSACFATLLPRRP